MDRRNFLRKGFIYTSLAGLYASTLGRIPLLALQRPSVPSIGNYDLVAVRGGEPEAMYKRAKILCDNIRAYGRGNPINLVG